MAGNEQKVMTIIHSENGPVIKEMTHAEAKKLSLTATCMSVIKSKKHNLGYPQGYPGELVTSFDQTVKDLKGVFGGNIDVFGWAGEDVVALQVLKARLDSMKDGDRFTAEEVTFMAKFMEKEGVLKELGLLEWSKRPCQNPACKHDA